jgi:hypothetical protein
MEPMGNCNFYPVEEGWVTSAWSARLRATFNLLVLASSERLVSGWAFFSVGSGK